jgi:hypothetical protein
MIMTKFPKLALSTIFAMETNIGILDQSLMTYMCKEI